MKERWSDIEGFPGYRVSSEGRVCSRKDYHGNLADDWHLLKPVQYSNGYLMVTLHDKNRQARPTSVHRLVARHFIPTDDETLVVDHLDGCKTNNRASNLEWVTGRENSIRACKAGLYEPAFIKTRRPVIITDQRNGEETYFRGVNEAARTLGFSPAVISKTANGLSDKFGHYTAEFAGREERLLHNKYYD